MIAVAVLGGMIGSGILGSDVGFGDLEREVAIDGASDRVVPGEIEFSVLEPLDDATPEMTVGLALSSDETPAPTCTIEDSGGDAVPVSAASLNEALLDLEGRYGEYTVVSTARLEPGEYRASCEVAGEPSASSGVSFTVGRVFGVADVGEMFGPLLGLLALWGVAGLVFIVGMVLLIVGLVQRSKSKRPPSVVGQYPPGQYPPVSTSQGRTRPVSTRPAPTSQGRTRPVPTRTVRISRAHRRRRPMVRRPPGRRRPTPRRPTPRRATGRPDRPRRRPTHPTLLPRRLIPPCRRGAAVLRLVGRCPRASTDPVHRECGGHHSAGLRRIHASGGPSRSADSL